MKASEQESYWQSAGYRGPTDPVVRAYVQPKLDLVESVLPLAERSILDVGCGPGLFTYHLARRARRVVGTDVSPWMLKNSQEVKTVRADAADLPFCDKSFDVTFEANLLHHVPNPARVVTEMTRVAREAVVIIEVNALNPVMFAFSLLNPAERGGLRSFRHYLCRLLKDAGLVVEHFWTTGMISQNNTPGFLVPVLKLFDFSFPFGEYHVGVARKPSGDAP
ncbi:MAG: class I SAM-dependent methyltransferase [Deltaproteobacteria bacterium]|nr:class I SAM-dependent methyltransferase [Deltaproteobacteria bacterium]